MANRKTLLLVIVLFIVLFIASIGFLAVYSGFYEDAPEYERPMIVINNYETKQEPVIQEQPSNYRQEPQQQKPSQYTYQNYYYTSTYTPVYPYYSHYPRYYRSYPRYISLYADTYEYSYPYYRPYSYPRKSDSYTKKIYY